MEREIINNYSWLILWLISLGISTQIKSDNRNGASVDKDNFVCKQKVLWRLRTCSQGKVACSKNKKHIEKAKHYIKAFSSFNRRRVEIAARKFRKIAPYIMPYIKTIYKALKNLQQQLEVALYILSIDKKFNIKIMCGDEKRRFLWYGIILKRDTYGLILVGDNGNVIDSIPINANDRWEISNYACDLRDSNTGYAIEIKIGNNPFLLRRNTTDSFIITESKYYNDSALVSHSLRKFYSIVRRNKITRKYKVIISDNESKEYDGIRNLVFSLDGQRYGFIAHKGNKEVAVIDGKETKEYDEIANLVFGAGGQRYGFIAKKENKWIAVIDGKESKEYDWILYLGFSPDEKRYGFIAKKENKWIVVIDGKEKSKEYDGIVNLVFSAGSQRYGFIAKKGNKWIAVIDGKETKKYDEVKHFVFSSNGRKYGFAAKRGDKRIAVINGKESKEYNYIRYIIFSSNSKRYGYVAKKENKWIVVIDGKESKEYDWILYLGFSPDEKRYGFIAKKENKWIVVIDGKESKEYDDIQNLLFSSDGKRYGFTAKKSNGKWVAVIDGEENEEYDKILYDAIRWGKDGKFYIYVGKKGDKYDIVVNGSIFRSLSNKPDFYTYKDGFRFIEYRNNKIYHISCDSRNR